MDYNSQSPFNGDPFTGHSSKSEDSGENLNEHLKKSCAITGPTPHVILTTSEIREQRLRKTIRKKNEKIAFWKKEYDALKKIMDLYPYIEKDWKYTKENSDKLAKLREYEKTVPLLVRENDNIKAENERLKKHIEALQKVADAY